MFVQRSHTHLHMWTNVFLNSLLCGYRENERGGGSQTPMSCVWRSLTCSAAVQTKNSAFGAFQHLHLLHGNVPNVDSQC